MRKYLTPRNIIISFLLSVSIAIYQYGLDRSRHERLERKGIMVKGMSYFKMQETGYAYFDFTTITGTPVHHSEKCSQNEFTSQYQPLFVIYNPDNPNEFDPLYDFMSYNFAWRNFFYLFLYPVFLTFFFILLFRNITLLLKFIKETKHIRWP